MVSHELSTSQGPIAPPIWAWRHRPAPPMTRSPASDGEEWQVEAEARGLLNLRTTVDALPQFDTPEEMLFVL